jgi:hypothetical protein
MGTSHDHTAGILVTLYCDTPVRVIRWGINIVTDHFDVGSAVAALQMTVHDEDGTITAAANVGTTTITPTTDRTEGTVLYAEPAANDEVICKVGDFLSVTLTTGGTAGDMVGWIQYQKLNWDETSTRADYDDAAVNRLVEFTT